MRLEQLGPVSFCINSLLEFVALSIFWTEEGSKQSYLAVSSTGLPNMLSLHAAGKYTSYSSSGLGKHR
eukprot:305867-Pelagomonas_calceolata.AAC.1